MRVTVPAKLTLNTFDQVYSQLYGISPMEEIRLDLTPLEWTEPAGLLPLAVRLRNHVLAGGGVVVAGFPEPNKSSYLERMDFYRIIRVKPPSEPMPRRAAEGRFIEITEIGSRALSKQTKQKLIKLVGGKVGIKDEIGSSFITACGELVENTKHAYNEAVDPQATQWPSALIHAQYYEDARSLHVCVADCGVGIRRSIGAKNPDWYEDDGEAVDAALVLNMQGRMGKYVGKGMGLSAIRRFMDKDGGRFSIRTGDCLAIRTPYKKTSNVSHWKGTVVALEIKTERPVDISVIIQEFERKGSK